MDEPHWVWSDHQDRPYIISKDGHGVMLTTAKGYFSVKNRGWQWRSNMFSMVNTTDVYRDSFVGVLDEVVEPYDWCVRTLGPNWSTWGSKIITLHSYKNSYGQQTGYHDLTCEFHFASKEDFALFKLSWA